MSGQVHRFVGEQVVSKRIVNVHGFSLNNRAIKWHENEIFHWMQHQIDGFVITSPFLTHDYISIKIL